jgi:predicted nucleic-acid-binding protein
MIAVDTNIVVRLLTQDDEQQYNKSLKLFQEQDIFIPDTVILAKHSGIFLVYLMSRYLTPA